MSDLERIESEAKALRRAVLDAMVTEDAALVEARSGGESSLWYDPAWAAAQRKMSAEMYRALNDYEAGRVSGPELLRRWSAAIDRATRSAYLAGVKKSGGLPDRGGELFLKRSQGAEREYASGFVSDIEADGVKFPGGAGARLGLYVNSWDSWRVQGWIDGDPDDRYEYHWVLHAQESCPDCLLLAANGPYTAGSLPCVPRSSDTQCKSRCKCELVRYLRSEPVSATTVKTLGLEDAPVANLLSPSPPPGLRTPTEDERPQIADLQYGIAYWRREAAEALDAGDEEAYRDALMNRKAMNADLIAYMESNGIHATPVLSVDEILTGADISAEHIAQLMADATDALTLGRVSGSTLRDILAEFESEAS